MKTLEWFDSFFCVVPYSVRVLLLLFFAILLLIMGLSQFALGMSIAVLALIYWNPDFNFLGLPLGLSGECRVCTAILYVMVLLLVNLTQIMMSWSRHLGDHWQQNDRHQNLAKKINEGGWITQKLYTLINMELDFFGYFYYKIHLLVFAISFIAFLIKR
ncbi:MAG: hypothetical protein V1690_01390 [Candidatus Moraniibacteriota bacterium]